MITQRKILNQLKKVFGDVETEKLLGKSKIDEIESDFKKVKSRFMQSTRPQISWTKKTMEQLVKAAGKEYTELYLYCYIFPLLQAHPSASSMFNRLEEDGRGISFDMNSDSNAITWPLISAHNLVLRIIDLQNDYFKLGLDNEIKERGDDFLACWKKP